LIYYRRYMGDFQADTMALSMMEQGAYDRLLDYYYATEQPIPLNPDRAAIICRAVTLEERAALAAVLDLFFTREADGFHNKRADHEIAVSRNARDNGGKGGRPRKTEHQTEHETETQTQTVTEHGTQTLTGEGGKSGHPPTTNHQPNTKPKPSFADANYSGGFLAFWETWPRGKRKVNKFKCWEVWRREGLDAIADRITNHVELMRGSRKWREGFDPLPMTYLNGRRWDDDVDPENLPI
jgi:uncharacterized protein YdaU (DUF1376 family)